MSIEFDRAAQMKDGGDPALVEQLAQSIASCSTVAETKALFDALEVEANKLGWPLDRDYAAVALQHYSATAISKQVRLRMSAPIQI
jgi:hypothetical protein